MHQPRICLILTQVLSEVPCSRPYPFTNLFSSTPHPGVFVFAPSLFSLLFTYSPTCSFLFMCFLVHLSNLKTFAPP